MNLSDLNFEEQSLTREDLLSIKGGVTSSSTISGATNCNWTESANAHDCQDIIGDNQQ